MRPQRLLGAVQQLMGGVRVDVEGAGDVAGLLRIMQFGQRVGVGGVFAAAQQLPGQAVSMDSSSASPR